MHSLTWVADDINSPTFWVDGEISSGCCYQALEDIVNCQSSRMLLWT